MREMGGRKYRRVGGHSSITVLTGPECPGARERAEPSSPGRHGDQIVCPKHADAGIPAGGQLKLGADTFNRDRATVCHS
jgi:hypothetical protein